MPFFTRIWKDITKGENIDLYVAVPLTIILAILNFIGLAPENLIRPMMLVVLGLLATALLNTRHAVAELSSILSKTPNSIFLDEFPASLRSDIENAKDLWIVGVSATIFIRSNYSLLEAKIRDGHQVRVLLVDPDSSAVEMTEMRSFIHSDIGRGQADILSSLQDLCHLKKAAPDKLQIHIIQYPIGFGMFAVNPYTASGVLYMKYYSFNKTTGDPRPKIVLHAHDGEWYDWFNSELKILWDNSSEWTCKGKNTNKAKER